MIIVVDSDGLIGMFDSEDAHFLTVQVILQKLSKSKHKLIYPATVIAETITLLKLRLKRREAADQIAELLLDSQLAIEPVDEFILKDAIILIEQVEKGSNHNTLFDGVVAAIAQKYNADAIFSFDKFYKKQGFKLALEL